MIKSEKGRVDLTVPDYEKLFYMKPSAAQVFERAHLYADLCSILDAIADEYGHTVVCDMMEKYLKETLEELSHEQKST